MYRGFACREIRSASPALCPQMSFPLRVEGDFLLVDPCCSAVVAVVVGCVDCAPFAVEQPDVYVELIVAGGVILCCQRSDE